MKTLLAAPARLSLRLAGTGCFSVLADGLDWFGRPLLTRLQTGDGTVFLVIRRLGWCVLQGEHSWVAHFALRQHARVNWLMRAAAGGLATNKAGDVEILGTLPWLAWNSGILAADRLQQASDRKRLWFRVHGVVLNDPGRLISAHCAHTALTSGWAGLMLLFEAIVPDDSDLIFSPCWRQGLFVWAFCSRLGLSRGALDAGITSHFPRSL